MARSTKKLLSALLFLAPPSATAVRFPDDDIILSAETGISDEFAAYVTAYGRDYVSGDAADELSMRQALFHERLAKINAHNAKPFRRWTASINELTDRTSAELAQLTGWRGRNKYADGAGAGSFSFLELNQTYYNREDWDKEVDYRNLSMGTEIMAQNACGSCWAVATTVMLEAHTEIYLDSKKTFSTQQLVNCVPNPKECGGTGGCSGATVELGMDYVTKMGLKEENEIPYQGKDGECPKDQKMTSASLLHEGVRGAEFAGFGKSERRARDLMGLKTWKTLEVNKANPLLAAILDGPVAVSVAANDWHDYGKGIFDNCKKDVVINHAVVLFGIGKEQKDRYWLIRNSWGNGWGEKGYIRLLRQETAEKEDAYCGTDNDPAKGVACKDADGKYPDKVTVCGHCGMLYDSVAVEMGKSDKKKKEESSTTPTTTTTTTATKSDKKKKEETKEEKTG